VRIAESAAIAGAPVSPRAPPAITTVPAVNLFPVRSRRGTSSSTRSLITPATPGAGALRGMPISTTSTRPACVFPGATQSPTFGA
jgi:hypothetical protein